MEELATYALLIYLLHKKHSVKNVDQPRCGISFRPDSSRFVQLEFIWPCVYLMITNMLNGQMESISRVETMHCLKSKPPFIFFQQK